MGLRETIDRIRADEARAQKYEAERPDRVARWLAHVESLYTSVREILSPFVEEGSTQIREGTQPATRPDLGSYAAPVLQVSVGKKKIIVQVSNENPAGFGGVVSCSRLTPAAVINLMLRLESGSQSWVVSIDEIQGEKHHHGNRQYVPATPDVIEEILDKLLS